MRAVFRLVFITLITIIIFSCSSFQGSLRDGFLIVHYYRFNRDYNNWNVWVWPSDPNGNGDGYEFGRPNRDGWVTAYVNFGSSANEVGYIIRRRQGNNDWAEKDTQQDRFTKAAQIWIVQDDPAAYTQRPDVSSLPIRFAAADTQNTVFVSLPKEPKDYSSFTVYQDGEKLECSSEMGRYEVHVIVNLNKPITDPSRKYFVRDESGEYSDKEIVMRRILDNFVYDGNDLGVTYRAASSVFKLWAPTAETVSVAVYDSAGTYNSIGRVTNHETDNLYPMSRNLSSGVWSAEIPGNLDGRYYMYRVQFANGKVNWAADPYAKAVSANGQRGAVVNLASTNPPNWRPLTKPPFSGKWQDAVLYELHVRDFSIDEESGMTNKGKFLAFTERGTRNRAGIPTGVDHIANLGITHIHLMPSFDFMSINELLIDDPSSNSPKFNWGYDPQNYNVPEGSYSTDPTNPAARIREYKQMVQALHNAGIRLIMDVVYNHTYLVDGSPFEMTVPGYYYRTNDNGQLTNGSGCGNETASERPMVRKFIVDSCLYWAKEYGVDGFRFDLMALHDRETMRQVSQKLWSEVDPTLFIYGEPWQAGGSPLPSSQQMNMGAQRGTKISIFNDRIRGAIKGGSDDSSRGFASGQTNREQNIVSGIRGSVQDVTDRASESINYVTCHDNLNLWDKFSLSWGAGNLKNNPYGHINANRPLTENNTVRSVMLANGIVLTSQGVPFFQAGDEFLRSKFGDHNSYQSPDSINRIRWENAGKYREVVEYYAGLIALRKAHPAFRMDSREEMERVQILFAQNRLVAFTIGGNANGDSWRNIFVAYNGSEQAQSVNLPAGTWNQTVNEQRAGVTPLSQASGSLTLPPLSLAVLFN